MATVQHLGDTMIAGTRTAESDAVLPTSARAPLSRTTTLSSLRLLFPSMHTLSRLAGIEDKSRFCGKKTLGHEFDVGIGNLDSAYIGQGSQFDVRKVIQCCNAGTYVQKSVLGAFMRVKSDSGARATLQRTVLLEFRALTYPPIRDHPNVVDLLDLGWETDPDDWQVKWPVLIMEYADRGTLLDFFCGDSLFSAQTKAKLCLDVVRGVGLLHDCGIIHGDLKMENVLVFSNPDAGSTGADQFTAKLADFGSSLADIDGNSKVSYTIPWNAPEYLQLLDHAGLKKTDIYSFGLLAWAVFIDGKDPFKELDSVAALLPPDSWNPSLEKLKRLDNGSRVLQLAKDSVLDLLGSGNCSQLLEVIDATVQLEPERRNLLHAAASLESFLQSKGIDIPEEMKMKPKSHPEILSGHAIILNSAELGQFEGPFRDYLEASVEAESGTLETSNSGQLHVLAELQLGDWFEGRHNDVTKAFDNFRKLRSGDSYNKAVVSRLARLLQVPLDSKVDEELRASLEDAFWAGSTAALMELKEVDSQWVSSKLWFPLICNGAVGEPTIDSNKAHALQTSNLPAAEAFAYAFPDLNIDISNTLLLSKTGDLAIHVASRVGSSSLLKQLLLVPSVDINCRNKELETPLLLACRSGRFEAAVCLVEAGADVTAQNIFSENALHWMHSFQLYPEQMKELAEKLLSKGSASMLSAVAIQRPSIDFPEHTLIQGTPICRAIVKGCLEAVRLLWRLESEVSPVERTTKDAIFLAARLQEADTLDILLTASSDLIQDNGTSILGVALGEGALCDSGVGRILRHGHLCKESGIATLKVLCKYGAREHFDEVPGFPGCNALSIAVSESPPELVEFLLNDLGCSKYVNKLAPPPSIASSAFLKGSVMYGLDNWKCPLLYTAINHKRQRVFQLLLDHQADPNATHASDQGRLNILHHCVVESRDTKLVKMLLDTGKIKDVDSAPDGWESPFATAVRMRKLDIAQCLLDRGADINRRAIMGYAYSSQPPRRLSVLEHLLVMGQVSLSVLASISFVLGAGKILEFKNPESEESLLHLLATRTQSVSERENNRLVRKIFELLHGHFRFTKAHLDLRIGSDGSTALELAVINCKAVLVEELLLAGASWDIRGPGPTTPKDTAVELALKQVYFFPQGVKIEEGFPSQEKQLQEAFKRRRRIALSLSRQVLARKTETMLPLRMSDPRR